MTLSCRPSASQQSVEVAMSTTKPQLCRLLALPRELRDLIYTFALTVNVPEDRPWIAPRSQKQREACKNHYEARPRTQPSLEDSSISTLQRHPARVHGKSKIHEEEPTHASRFWPLVTRYCLKRSRSTISAIRLVLINLEIWKLFWPPFVLPDAK